MRNIKKILKTYRTTHFQYTGTTEDKTNKKCSYRSYEANEENLLHESLKSSDDEALESPEVMQPLNILFLWGEAHNQ